MRVSKIEAKISTFPQQLEENDKKLEDVIATFSPVGPEAVLGAWRCLLRCKCGAILGFAPGPVVCFRPGSLLLDDAQVVANLCLGEVLLLANVLGVAPQHLLARWHRLHSMAAP